MFSGFTLPDESSSCTIALPANWPEVSKAIDNLAELKVVQLVLWVIWGNSCPDAPLSIEDFMEVTGLCRRSVITGIGKAIEHGYISRQDCEEDCTVCIYGVQLAQTGLDEQDMSCQESFDQSLMQDFPECANFASAPMQDLSDTNFVFSPDDASEADLATDATFVSSSNEFELPTHSNISGDILRKQEDTRCHPCKGLLTREDNATLNNRVESLSKALGDHEHIGPNIGQARRILAQYVANGGNFEDFLLLMYEARDLARRKTKIRRKNRMPYFFTCLKNASKIKQVA